MINKHLPQLPNKYHCTGCMACGDVCDKKCISFELKDDGHFVPIINRNNCIQCMKCMNTCPVLIKKKPLSSKSSPYSVWAKNEKLRLRSSSGGTFAQMATKFIESGGYVVGAAIDGINVKHIIINNIDELWRIQGSKYIQSVTIQIYKEIFSLLRQGHSVLFSGTGCQVSACYNVIPKKYWENLYTIDLICHGVPSRNDLNLYINHQKEKIVSIDSFRDKSWKFGYAMTCRDDCGNIVRTEDNYFFAAFNNNKTLRWSCYDCNFKTGFERCSDITLGDFWGAKSFDNEKDKGVSLCIVHSDKGKELMNNDQLISTPTSWDDCIKKNKDYFLSTNYYRYHPLRLIYPFALKHFSYKFITQMYGNMHISSLVYPVLMLVDSFFQHINYKKQKKETRKLLCKS